MIALFMNIIYIYIFIVLLIYLIVRPNDGATHPESTWLILVRNALVSNYTTES